MRTRTNRTGWALLLASVSAATACGSQSSAGAPSGGAMGTNDGGGQGGNGMPGAGGGPGAGGFEATGGAGGLGMAGSVGSIAPGGVPTKLPLVPELGNVVATANDDSARVVFDPFLGAKDYRVYELPKDEDITIEADGTVKVTNGLYRCGGARFGPRVPIDAEPQVSGGAFHTSVEHDVNGHVRTLPEATLGHVWVTPGPGRVPVYALGDPAMNADNHGCFFHRWGASRVKLYTTSEQERAMLLGARWRDDGVVFYVPAAAGAETQTVFTTTDPHRMYFVEGAEKAKRKAPAPAFEALKAAAADTQPLMRVYYKADCGRSHDELVPGQERFERVRRQGAVPLTALLWSPLNDEKILVVEALDAVCPYQGVLSTTAFPAYGPYEPFFTLEQQRTTVFAGPDKTGTAPNPTGEIFINGQADGTRRPKAIARSFVKIKPHPRPAMDWFAGFKDGSSLAPFTPVPTPGRANDARGTSSEYDLTWYSIDRNSMTRALQSSAGPLFGELLVTYLDFAADTDGKIRLTPTTKATVSATTYLHATMEVDILSSTRRYPQILISSAMPPVQENLPMATTVIVQTFGAWPIQLQVQLCERRSWNVNNQCPRFDLAKVGGGLAPVPELGEWSGIDWRVRFDVYASSKRVFVFLDEKPYGCVDLPGNGLPAGPATVTFGDVLYHSGADLDNTPWYPFHLSAPAKPTHMLLVAKRHFDNLGYSSNVGAPPWDPNRFPCQGVMTP
jgi:hypothetical protein